MIGLTTIIAEGAISPQILIADVMNSLESMVKLNKSVPRCVAYRAKLRGGSWEGVAFITTHEVILFSTSPGYEPVFMIETSGNIRKTTNLIKGFDIEVIGPPMTSMIFK